uniref:hypothetical protein n=1 Tax=Bartonella sp. CL32QHWL-2 TaxID=3243525 RepID=UPI0035CE8DF3
MISLKDYFSKCSNENLTGFLRPRVMDGNSTFNKKDGSGEDDKPTETGKDENNFVVHSSAQLCCKGQSPAVNTKGMHTSGANNFVVPKMKEYDVSTIAKAELCRNCKRWTLCEYRKNLNSARYEAKTVRYQFCSNCNSTTYDDDFKTLEINIDNKTRYFDSILWK